MPYVAINIILDKALKQGSVYSFPYPDGKSKGSFFGTFNHTLAAGDHFYRAPGDFLIIEEDDRLVLNWRHHRVLPQGIILYLQLSELGSSFYFDQLTGVTVQNVVPASVFMVNLGTPQAGRMDAFAQNLSITEKTPLALRGVKPDVPRNVTISCTEDNQECVFTVEGEDLYERVMMEEIVGPSNGCAEGKKAFAKLHRVTPSQPCSGTVNIGYGNRLGLPVFLPGVGFVLRELFNGEERGAGTIISGETGIPNPRTNDRRGSYIPPENIVLDGKTLVLLLVSLPNPGNIGSAGYTS